MNKFEEIVKKISRLFDVIAGWGIVAIMVLVVSNIFIRELFGKPILGVYEYVGFIIASAIGLALAYCAVQNAHIAIEYLVEKLPIKVQRIIDILIRAIILFFLGFISYQVIIYALKLADSGEVSTTTQTPFYPFILVVAIGLIMLWMVVFTHFIRTLRLVAKK